MGAERWDEQVGSVADEAGRLLESLRRSAAESAAHDVEEDGEDGRDAAGPGSAPGSAGVGASPGGMPGAAPEGGSPGAGPDGAAHDPLCTWCPLCRGAAVVRSLSPQTLAKLADLATLAATVFTDLASSRAASGSPASEGEPDDAATGAGRSRRSTAVPSRPIPVSDAHPQEAPRG